MRLLWFSFLVLLPAIAFSSPFGNETDDPMVALGTIRKLYYERYYEYLRSWLARNIQRSGIFYKELPEEFIRAFSDVVKTLLPHYSHPTPEKLQQLADDTFEAGRQLYEEYHRDNLTIISDQLVHNVSTNTTMLQSSSSGGCKSQYKISCAMREAIQPYSTTEYIRWNAVISRCYFDKWRKYPKMNLTAEELPTVIERKMSELAKCRDEANGMTTHAYPHILFGQREVIEFLQSKKNVEAFIKTINIFMEAVKNPNSYESFESFAEHVKASRFLKAAAQIIIELRRCGREASPENMKPIDEKLSKMASSPMFILASEEASDAMELSRAVYRGTVGDGSTRLSESDFSKMNEVTINPKFRKCLIPESAVEEVLQLKPVLDGNRADEDKHLQKVSNISKTLESIVQIFYEHLHDLRNRVELTDETRNFFTLVLRKFYELARTDGTTEEGKATQEEVLKELRESFIGLSDTAKGTFTKHLPLRTICFLAAIF